MSDQEEMHWFNHDGGPLILLPREALTFWEGIEPPSGGRIVEADFRWDNQEIATDYDRACDISEWAEVVPVGPDSWGMILPEDAAVGLLMLEEQQGMFVVVQSYLQSYLRDDDTDTLASFSAALIETMADHGAWAPSQGDLLIRNGDVLLMHAAWSGDSVDEIPWTQTAGNDNAQVVNVTPGVYFVDQYKVPDGRHSVALFTRFRLRIA